MCETIWWNCCISKWIDINFVCVEYLKHGIINTLNISITLGGIISVWMLLPPKGQITTDKSQHIAAISVPVKIPLPKLTYGHRQKWAEFFKYRQWICKKKKSRAILSKTIPNCKPKVAVGENMKSSISFKVRQLHLSQVLVLILNLWQAINKRNWELYQN